jgi:hypothetical protein
VTSVPAWETAPMRSCLVLGAGRSGTSLAAGLLAQAGYVMGERLLPATDANPAGYFEDVDINALNEDLLEQVVPGRPAHAGWLFRHRPTRFQRWLSAPPLGASFTVSSEQRERMNEFTARRPFCYKDPRFSFTLPAWRPSLGDAAFVCVFRNPAVSSASMLREVNRDPDLDLRFNLKTAYSVWLRAYEHVLHVHRHEGDWLFVDYDQLLDGRGAARMSRHLDVELSGDFADPSLNRSKPAAAPPPARLLRTYDQLLELAQA